MPFFYVIVIEKEEEGGWNLLGGFEHLQLAYRKDFFL